MFAVDFSILTVALPKIGQDLGFAIDNLQWVVSAFALTAAGFMLLFGRIGDIVGHKKLFIGGMVLLTVSSLVGGLSGNQEILLGSRVAQGLATAIVTPNGMALLTTSFEEGSLRNKALGLNGALLSLGFACGSVLGGILTDVLSWRWDFFINVPVGLVIVFAAPAVISESRSKARPKLDFPGAVTVTLGLLAFVLGITNAGRSGWGAPVTWGALIAAAVLLTAFYLVEMTARDPLAPLRILKANTVKWGNLGGLVTFSMESALSFLLTLYLQQVLQLTPLQTGLMFGFLGVGAFIGGTVASRIIGAIGPKYALVLGLSIQAVMTASLYALGDSKITSIVAILVATFIGGFGHVIAIVAYTVIATSGIADSEQGLATGLATMTQQIGFTLGIPVMSAIAATQYGKLVDGSATRSGVLSGTTFGILIDGLIVVAGALIITLFLRSARKRVTVPAEPAVPEAEVVS
jgi:EmrB/QacA subfamily drug resistance transporter